MIAERLETELQELRSKGNHRVIPDERVDGVIDLSSNDYLGLAARKDILERFLNSASIEDLEMTSAASRLLAARQNPYIRLERALSRLYDGRPVLLFNSGYHANTGIISAIASKRTIILADKLVHASIIDGIKLSGAEFNRFRHNDINHLKRLLEKAPKDAELLVIVESVYSMDGDAAPIDGLIELKRHYAPRMMLYVDEAHAFGAWGPSGKGLVAASTAPDEVDIIVGTLGKAAASMGAFAITSPLIKDYLINRVRSLIFSTAIPPICASWSEMIVDLIPSLQAERDKLQSISAEIGSALGLNETSHIIPYIVGDARETVELSHRLRKRGIKVLPIRTPTVAPGTERLRISLSAALTDEQIAKTIAAFHEELHI